MKTSVATLVLLGAALTAGLALAQTPQQPRGGEARAEPGSGAGETRATINQSGGTLAMETLRPTVPAVAPNCDGTTGAEEVRSSRRYEELGTRATVTQTGLGGGMERGASSTTSQPVPTVVPGTEGNTRIGERRSSRSTTAPINGIGSEGGGRYTFNQPRPPVAAAAETVPVSGQGQRTTAFPTSLGGRAEGEGGFGGGRTATAGPNRDHIDQDAQFDARGVRLINNSESDTTQVDGAAARPETGGSSPAILACTPTPAPRR